MQYGLNVCIFIEGAFSFRRCWGNPLGLGISQLLIFSVLSKASLVLCYCGSSILLGNGAHKDISQAAH
jgi:hypothetical protein